MGTSTSSSLAVSSLSIMLWRRALSDLHCYSALAMQPCALRHNLNKEAFMHQEGAMGVVR